MSNYRSHTDKALFALLAEGDEQAFRSLLERFQPNVFGQAMNYLKDVQKAQDVVQEVFLSLWKNRQRIKGMESPQGYLFATARNRITDEFRKKLTVPLAPDAEEIQEALLPVDEKLELKQQLALIQTAINQLPPQRKRIFEMSKKEGMKYQEIADELGISRETVKVQIVKALAAIRAALPYKVPVVVLLSLLQ